jgi:Activator of Hsp90 ATPase homolog 1-like protein
VLDWEPPRRLRYLWHLFFDASQATEIEITFTAFADGTKVRLEQRGWERLGEPGGERRARTATVWDMLVVSFQGACRELVGAEHER